MKTKFAALALALILLTLFTGCGPGEVSLIAQPSVSLSPDSVSPSASATPTPTIAPSASASVDGAISDVPGEIDVTLGDSFVELAKNCDLVVRGKFVEKLKEPYNQIRDINDPDLPDPEEKILEWQFILEVSETYKLPKNTEIKKGDKITVNLAYEDNNHNTDYKPKSIPSYFEPDLNSEVVLFLYQNTLDLSIYYPDVTPFFFDVKEEKLYARSNNKSDVESFEKKMKLDSGEGAPVANLKKDLGVK